jgi:hypothetical protein
MDDIAPLYGPLPRGMGNVFIFCQNLERRDGYMAAWLIGFAYARSTSRQSAI